MTTVDNNEHVLGDNPTDDDKLGFAEPAARLADKIARFPADTPMVVGVEGKWGEGKSSFLLMMKKHWREQAYLAPKGFCAKLRQFFQEKVLRKKLVRQIKLIEFDPWWFSGKDNLLDKLLKELEGQESWLYSPIRNLLKSLEKQASTDNAWLKSKLEVVALVLAAGMSTALNPMLDWFGDSVSNAIKPWLKSGQTALLVLGLFWLIKLGLRAIIAKLAPPEGFDARKKKLETLLRKDRFQRVVFIDDLDRLPADELQEMFRVIKSVANFPNVVYVLAYDREVVSTALDKFHPGRGELFLEKIVQMPVALPVPTPHMKEKAYREIFSSVPAIHKILQKSTDQYLQSEQGWALICAGFINNTRQAKRVRDAINTQYNQDFLIHPLFFLFLEAFYLRAATACTALCQAICDYENRPCYNPSLDWGAILSSENANQDTVTKEGLKKLQEWIGTQDSKEILLSIVRRPELECIAFFLGFPTEPQKRPFSLIPYKTATMERAGLAEQEERSRACARYLYKKLEPTYWVEFMLSEVKTKNQLFEFIAARTGALLHYDYLVRELGAYLSNRVMEHELLEKACSLALLIAEVAEELYLQPEIYKNHSCLYFFQKSFKGLQAYFDMVQQHSEHEFYLEEFNQEVQKNSPFFALNTLTGHTAPDLNSIYDMALLKHPFSSLEQALAEHGKEDTYPCVAALNYIFINSSQISLHTLNSWLSSLPAPEKLNISQKEHLKRWVLGSLRQEGENSKLIIQSTLSYLIPSIRDTLQKTQEDDLLAVLDKLAPEAESNP